MDDVVAELVEEMKTLRRGRGILEGRIEDRVGRTLRAACGVSAHSNPTEIRRLVTDRLTTLAEQLPQDLHNAVLAAFALLPDTRQRFYQERVRWVAQQLDRDERTAQRRINEGFRHLAELAAASMTETAPGHEEWTPPWQTEKLWVSLVLDQPNPEAFEWRRIVSNRDGLREIDLAFTLTAPPPGGGTPEDATDGERLGIAMLYGGTLVRRQMETSRRFSFVVVLPEELGQGDRAEFALRFTVPDGQPMRPHYVCVPKERCALFDLRVRFDPARQPHQVWQLSKVFQNDIDDPDGQGDVVSVDAANELHLRFDDLTPGFAYGARWDVTPSPSIMPL